MTLRELLLLPWNRTEPVRQEEDGVAWFEIRVKELPDFLVAGETVDEVNREFRDALESHLAAYVAQGEVPELPKDQAWVMTRYIPKVDQDAIPVFPTVLHLPQGYTAAR